MFTGIQAEMVALVPKTLIQIPKSVKYRLPLRMIALNDDFFAKDIHIYT